jgi:D-xylose transport system ATP-binding protein
VILDEPTAALGLRESAEVLQLVRRLPEQGISVILVSHNLDHVMQVADRAVVLRQGRQVGEAIPTAEHHTYLGGLLVAARGVAAPAAAELPGSQDQEE